MFILMPILGTILYCTCHYNLEGLLFHTVTSFSISLQVAVENKRITRSNFIPTVIKVKGKVVPVLLLIEHHAMKAYLGSGGIALLIV